MPRSQLQVVAAVLAAFVFVGCHAQTAPESPWATLWLDSLNSRQLDNVGRLFLPNGTYEDPLSGGPRSGPSSAYYFLTMWKKFPEARYRASHVISDNDRLVVEWTAAGIPTVRPGPPLKGAFVIQLQDNAIASVRGYYDTAQLR